MQTSTRVIFNTIILYIKVITSLAIALVSVPLVLKALGASDYGLYNLVAGVVAMLAFLNNSMTVSSQRYMSVAIGESNERKIISIYNTSFLLHLGLGLFVVVAFEIINSAIENVVDLASNYHFSMLAKNAKDMAAGAVLVVSGFALLTGLVIFVPKFWALVFG